MATDPQPTAEVAVSLQHIVRHFPTAGADVVALDDVTATIHAGRLTVIAGPSGSGKSTLLAMIACLDRPSSGTVTIAGEQVEQLATRSRRAVRRHRLGIVLPLPSDNLLDRFDAIGNLAWAATMRTGTTPTTDELSAALDQVGLLASADKGVRELSGGEQQRLALACALVGDPTLVVADEPTASLDRASSATVVDALRAAADRGVTLIVASHDAHVMHAADVLISLDHGRRVS